MRIEYHNAKESSLKINLHDATLKHIIWQNDSKKIQMYLFDTWNQQDVEIIFEQVYAMLGENFHPWGDTPGINDWTVDSNLSKEVSDLLNSKKIVLDDNVKIEILTAEFEFLSGDYLQIVCKELHVNTI